VTYVLAALVNCSKSSAQVRTWQRGRASAHRTRAALGRCRGWGRARSTTSTPAAAAFVCSWFPPTLTTRCVNHGSHPSATAHMTRRRTWWRYTTPTLLGRVDLDRMGRGTPAGRALGI